jgi:hypothetical protein
MRREKRKTLVFQATANVNPSTHPNGTAGPYGLGYGDIYQLHAVYQSPDFSTPATQVAHECNIKLHT